MGSELAKQVKELRDSRLKTVCLDLNYAEVTGIVAAVSQHLYNMEWSHLMDDEPRPSPEGFLQKRWHSLYHKAMQASSELSAIGHKGEDLADEKNFTL